MSDFLQADSALRSDGELIARPNRFAVGEDNLQELFALHVPADLVFQGGDNLFCLDVDDFTG